MLAGDVVKQPSNQQPSNRGGAISEPAVSIPLLAAAGAG